MPKLNLICLPGDGIGPEVMAVALAAIDRLNRDFDLGAEAICLPFGGASTDAHGTPLTDDVLARCRASDAVLLAAVGGPKWDAHPPAERPEAGLLRIRKELGLFCNLRPAKAFASLVDSSPLKQAVIDGTDMMVVRELIGGIYFGEPRGLTADEGFNTDRYSRGEVTRIAKAAFDLARARRGKVTSVDKANVLEVSRLWRDAVNETHRDYPDVELAHLYVDNAAMQMVRAPASFDVMLTSNMFGDILSDLAGMLTGSLGMLPSASLGDQTALYEPIHGSAPDIAGQDRANPLGTVASLAMALRHSLGRPDLGALLDRAIEHALERGYRTADVAAPGARVVGTAEMAQRLLESVDAVAIESENKTETVYTKNERSSYGEASLHI